MSSSKIINFMGQRKIAALVSIVLVVASIVSLAVNKLEAGLDFTGGIQVEVSYQQPANLNDIRAQLNDAGFSSPEVRNTDSETEVVISMQYDEPEPQVQPTAEGEQVDSQNNITINERVENILRSAGDDLVIKKFDRVGPQIGVELRDKGGLGMLIALAVVMLYVAMRFQMKFSLGAVAALIHDVIITLGVFSILGLEFNLSVLAAVLAVIGYSLNDTIVVSDRIRENFRLLRKASPMDVINESLTQTLGRTLITSLTTLLVLLALFFVGGDSIHNFSIALIIGVVVGTYSSIYVAANILLAMHIDREDLVPSVKEGELVDDMP